MQLIVVTKHFWSDAGLANASRELTKELVKLGAHLVAVIHADPHVDRTMEPKPDVEPISVDMTLPPPLRYYLASKRAADVLKSIRSDYGDDCVIHSHSLFPSAFLANEKKAVFITTIHGTERGEIERFRKEIPVHPRELLYRLGYISSWYIGGATIRRNRGHIIALSSSNAYDIMTQGVPPRLVHVIPNGVDGQFYKPNDRDEARRTVNLPLDSPIVLTINAIQARKGLHTLVKAARIVTKEIPDAYFVIVGRVDRGAGWYATYIKRLIEKSGLDAHFKFTGFVSKQELPLFMSACDVFTLTSYAEGAPLVIPEAMACSRTVIATQGAAADYLPANLIVQNGDHNGLAQKISFYLSNMKDCDSCGKELRREAVNEFSWTNIAKRTFALYKECGHLD